MAEETHLAPAGARASVPRGWLAVILGSLSALAPLSIDMYLPALPSLQADFGVSTSVAQLSLTFCMLGLAAGQLIAGPVSDARGRRRTLLTGMGLYALASALCGLTHAIGVLILVRLCQGLAGAAGIVVGRAVARDYFSGIQLTQFYALLMLVNGAAPVLAPVIGAQVLRFTSWHGVFAVLAGLGVLILCGVWFGLPESLPADRRTAGGLQQTVANFRALLSNRSFMGLVFTQSLVGAAMFAYIAGSPFVLQKIYGVSPQTFSFIFAANGIGIVLAGQTSAWMARRFGEMRVLRAGVCTAFLAGVLLFLALVLHLPLYAVLPPLFIVVSCVGVTNTTGTSLAMNRYGHVAGSASGLIGVCQMVFGALMTPLVGLGGSLTARPMAITMCACDTAALLVFWTMVHRRGEGAARR
ncbi:MAG: multidrug effflux MFS transporter [Alicyclobacillus sp.]|nr:multidrug effflux MFS transporter [Alicyclobacillus sp.]